jgi:hypothetical protein
MKAAGYRDPMQDAIDAVHEWLAAQDSSRGDDISDIHGWIGVRIQAVTADIADGLGLKKVEGALIAEPQFRQSRCQGRGPGGRCHHGRGQQGCEEPGRFCS